MSRPAAIVTGAAGGIGLEFTKRLLERGYRVVLADIDSERGTQVQKELGSDTLFVHCDVADWSSQASLFKTAYEWADNISVFLANAGIEETEPFYSLPEAEEPAKPDMKVFDVDLHSVIYALKLFRHYRRKSADGGIGKLIATGSMAAIYEFPAAPVYSAAKHGVVGVFRSSSYKLLKNESITLNTINPGPVDTNISEFMKKVVPAEQFTPMSRLITALDKVLDEDITGQVIECSSQGLYLRQPVEYADSNSRFLLQDMKRFLG